ncbi:uncharacterized protein LOC129784316 [Falco peregrinus]|uniref:uncharacterized protein LOC129784316 n=1 Tax=Falco peregrinus TaxID=8954 RepID=UPI002478F72A|nr:uncharacterized protein LOC129784316 [Falco peregrinus]
MRLCLGLCGTAPRKSSPKSFHRDASSLDDITWQGREAGKQAGAQWTKGAQEITSSTTHRVHCPASLDLKPMPSWQSITGEAFPTKEDELVPLVSLPLQGSPGTPGCTHAGTTAEMTVGTRTCWLLPGHQEANGLFPTPATNLFSPACTELNQQETRGEVTGRREVDASHLVGCGFWGGTTTASWKSSPLSPFHKKESHTSAPATGCSSPTMENTGETPSFPSHTL